MFFPTAAATPTAPHAGVDSQVHDFERGHFVFEIVLAYAAQEQEQDKDYSFSRSGSPPVKRLRNHFPSALILIQIISMEG